MLHIQKSLKQRLLSGGIWAFSAKAGSGFITIALTALITRLLEPVDVGVLFLSFSIIIMMSLIIRMGMDQLGIKLIGEALSEKKYQIARNIVLRIIILVTIFSIIWAVLIYILFDYFDAYLFSGKETSLTFRLVFSIWIVVVSIQLLFAEIFRSYHHISYASVFSGGTVFGGFLVSLVVGLSLLILYMAGIKVSLEMLLSIIVTVTCAFLVVEIYVILKILGKFENTATVSNDDNARVSYIRLVKQGFPFFVTLLSLSALIHMDTIILGFFRTEEEVAVYAASTRIVKLIVLSLIVAYEVVAPVIVELNAKKQKEKLQEILRITATIAAVPSSIALLFFIIYADVVLDFLYGEFYKEGAVILIILSAGQLVNVWTGLCGYTLNMLGHQKVVMYIYSSVTVIALAFCVIFAKEYGAISIAYIISIAWALQNITALIFTKYLTGMWTHASIQITLKQAKIYMQKRSSEI